MAPKQKEGRIIMNNNTFENVIDDIFGENEKEACKAVLEDVNDGRSTTFDLLALPDDDILSIHVGRSGREIAWYYDGERESARYIDTKQRLTAEEIENELC